MVSDKTTQIKQREENIKCINIHKNCKKLTFSSLRTGENVLI